MYIYTRINFCMRINLKHRNSTYILCMFFIKNQDSLLTFLSTAVTFYSKELQYPIDEVKHRAI